MKMIPIGKAQYIRVNFLFLVLLLSVFAVFSISNNIFPLNYILTFYAILHLTWFGWLCMHDFEQIQTVQSFYHVFVMIAIAPLAIISWKNGYPIAFFWYLLIPLSALVYKFKQLLLWAFATLVMIVVLILIAPCLDLPISITDEQLYAFNIMSVVFGVALAVLLIVYHFIFNQSAEFAEKYQEIDVNFSTLYADILAYFDKNQPYLNSDFDILQLAANLNSNQNYIGKAIKIGSGTNFNTFVNTYRVNKVKTMLDDDLYSKFTMEHIYTSAGFNYQTTFNRVFKEITGKTPTQYLNYKAKMQEKPNAE